MMNHTKLNWIRLLLVSAGLLLLLLTGCLSEALGMRGNPTPVLSPRTGSPTSNSNSPTSTSPTRIPYPTDTPQPTQTPVPTTEPTFTPDIQATVQAMVQEQLNLIPTEIPEPTQEPTEIPIPSPTPKPTPTPKYRPVVPAQSLGIEQFEFTEGPTRVDQFKTTFTAEIEGKDYEPTQIQVFQSLRFEDYGGTCSTEKPIAFVFESGGFGSVYYPWTYCPYPGSPSIPCGDTVKKCSSTNPDASVPFIKAKVWDYDREPPTIGCRRWSSGGTRCLDSYEILSNTWVWKVEIDLIDNRARDRMYNSPAGYVLILFSGDTILSRAWVDWDD